MAIKENLKRLFLLIAVLIAAFILELVAPARILALSDSQKQVLGSKIFYFNTEPDQATTCATPTTSSSASGQFSPVYFVGDSIGTQIQSTLPTALGGAQFKANALAGRNLSTEPPTPDGLKAIDQDQDYIKTANTVIIELGTNAGGFTAQAVGQMVSKIHSLSANATVYWVDTAVVQRADYAKTLDGVNSIIYSQASVDNYKVISWNKKVFGDSADPQNIDAYAPDNGYIRRSDEYVHLTDAGIQAMTGLIAGTVNGSSSAVDSNGCACTVLSGNDNAEKVWNYFIGKGLPDFQVAAIMGNLQAESGFNPRRVQNTSTPSGDSDIVPTDGKTGYGIAQWTSAGRQQGLIDFAQKQGKSPSDLGLQLDYVWYELNGPMQSVFNDFKQTTDIAGANNIFGHRYEGYGTDTEQLRLNFANSWLLRFGSGSANSGSNGPNSNIGSSC